MSETARDRTVTKIRVIARGDRFESKPRARRSKPGSPRRIGSTDGEASARAFVRALFGVRAQDPVAMRAPLVLLGGDGGVGRRIQRLLHRCAEVFYVVDPARGTRALPDHLRRVPVLLLDVSRRGVLQRYLSQIGPGSVVVTKTVLEPDRAVVRELRERGCAVFPVAGVEDRVYPSPPGSFPDAVA